MCSNYTMESYLTINEMGMPDLLPDVIPKERRPSGPPEEPDIEFEEDNPHLIQQFAIEGGMASFNEVKIVPLMTFDDVVRVTGKIDQN